MKLTDGRRLPEPLIVFVAVLLIVGSLIVVGLNPPEVPVVLRAAGDTNFTSVVASDDLTAGDDLTVGDDATLGGWLTLTPQTVISVADDGWLTPTGSLQGIQSGGAIGFSRIYTTGFSDGDLLIIYNVVANSIVITDEKDTNLGGNRTLGIGDNLMLVYTNTSWNELSTTNN